MKTVSALVVLIALLSPLAAGADVKEVCATQVEASGTPAQGEKAKVDPKLEKMRMRLPRGYGTYRWIAEECWDLEVGEGSAAALSPPYSLAVRRLEDEVLKDEGKVSRKAKVHWTLRKGKETMQEFDAKFANHGFLWVGGARTDKGDLFVLLHAHWGEDH